MKARRSSGTPLSDGQEKRRAPAVTGGATPKLPTGAESRAPSLGHIESYQASALLLFLTAATSFLAFPALVVMRAGNAGWLAMILSSALACVALYGWMKWSETAPGIPLVALLRSTLGRFFGDAVAFFIFAYFASSGALLGRVFSGGTVIGLLTEVPIEILQGSLVAMTAYGAWLGLEPLARAGVILAPVVTIALVVVFLASFPMLDLRRVLPVFGLGPGAIAAQGFRGAGVFAGAASAVILRAYLRDPGAAKKTALGGLGFGASFMILTTLLVASVFPYPESTRQLFPLGVMSRSILLGKFLQRLEAVFSFSWFFFIAVHLSVTILLAVVVFSQLVDAQTVRPLIFPVSSFAFGLGLLPPSLIHAVSFLDVLYATAGNGLLWLGWVLYAVSRFTVGKRHGGTGRQMPPSPSGPGAPRPSHAAPDEERPGEDHNEDRSR